MEKRGSIIGKLSSAGKEEEIDNILEREDQYLLNIPLYDLPGFIQYLQVTNKIVLMCGRIKLILF